MTLPAMLMSAPMISIDSANYDAGILQEGEVKSIKNVFIVKNTGDSALVIQQVKPGCGCTAVGHDSIIQPGKTGKITSEVDIRGMHGGTFRKYITVVSNAKNAQTLRISLGGNIMSYIDYSPGYLRFIPDSSNNITVEMKLSTAKKGLKVSEVQFKSQPNQGNNVPEWQRSMPIFPSYKLIEPDSVKADGYYDYTLRLTLTNPDKQSKHGNFIIKTNHPKKAEISVPGMIMSK